MNGAADIVICGAGITGPVVAHYLSRAGTKNILLLEAARQDGVMIMRHLKRGRKTGKGANVKSEAGRLRHSRPGVRESRLETFLTV